MGDRRGDIERRHAALIGQQAAFDEAVRRERNDHGRQTEPRHNYPVDGADATRDS